MLGSIDSDDDAVGIELTVGSEDGLLLDAAIAGFALGILSPNLITSSLESVPFVTVVAFKAVSVSFWRASFVMFVEFPPVTTTTMFISN